MSANLLHFTRQADHQADQLMMADPPAEFLIAQGFGVSVSEGREVHVAADNTAPAPIQPSWPEYVTRHQTPSTDLPVAVNAVPSGIWAMAACVLDGSARRLAGVVVMSVQDETALAAVAALVGC